MYNGIKYISMKSQTLLSSWPPIKILPSVDFFQDISDFILLLYTTAPKFAIKL